MFIVMVAFDIGKESKHYCRHMWKFAFGFTVAELKNRLDTMNTKSNRKHVDNIAVLLSELVIRGHIYKVERYNLWQSTGGFRCKDNS